jgi:hypothetical protein
MHRGVLNGGSTLVRARLAGVYDGRSVRAAGNIDARGAGLRSLVTVESSVDQVA